MKPNDRLPPHSLEAERAVLGGILFDHDSLIRVKPMLEVDDFYSTPNQRVYAAMLDLYEEQSIPDLTTVNVRLKDKGELQKIGGSVYLAQLVDEVPSAANIEHHARIVKEKAMLRRIMEQAQEIIQKAMEPGANPESLPIRLSIDSPQAVTVSHVSDITRTLNRNIQSGYPGLYPCYDLLARTIRKVSPGHLWVVGAYTSTGKSAWLVDFVCRLYRQYALNNPSIAIFSTEMSCEQYLLRCLSNQTKIPTWCITENVLTPAQLDCLAAAQSHFNSKNFFLYDKLYKIEDIEHAARTLKESKCGLDIVAIDYLQNLWGDGTIYDRMSRLAPILQYLAKELQVTIIALSQVSNQYVREKGSSGVYGYKGAGEIAASADLGISLSRDSHVKERMIFAVEKNRHGRLGEGVLNYVCGYSRLEEQTTENDENGG